MLIILKSPTFTFGNIWINIGWIDVIRDVLDYSVLSGVKSYQRDVLGFLDANYLHSLSSPLGQSLSFGGQRLKLHLRLRYAVMGQQQWLRTRTHTHTSAIGLQPWWFFGVFFTKWAACLYLDVCVWQQAVELQALFVLTWLDETPCLKTMATYNILKQ